MSSSKDQPAAKSAAAKAFVPLKPRRKLAIALLVLFMIWIVILYVLYFTTVHGHAG
jgi:hypothetical protein